MGPLFFTSVVISIYGLVSMVLPLKLKAAFKLPLALLLVAGAFKNDLFNAFGGGMFFAPDLPRWMVLWGSLIFNVLVIALFMLIVKDVMWIIARFVLGAEFPSSDAALAVLLLSCAVGGYGTLEAIRVPSVAYHDVEIKGLAPEFEGKKIALLVDLHASALNKRDLIRSIVDETNALSPDLVLIPGDFVDGTVAQREDDVKPLRLLRAPLGVFGTAGNHDYYSGYGAWMEKLSELGITMLENSHVVLTISDASLVIAGVTDERGVPDIDAALAGAPDAPTILLAHRPLAAREYAKRGVDLQLSGHTHGGMMPVLNGVVAKMNGGFVKGWYDVDGMKLFNSPGTSLWCGFPMRLFDPAEISLITIHR